VARRRSLVLLGFGHLNINAMLGRGRDMPGVYPVALTP
jgi:hypothetical protein